jgi:hypothetical protein
MLWSGGCWMLSCVVVTAVWWCAVAAAAAVSMYGVPRELLNKEHVEQILVLQNTRTAACFCEHDLYM